MAEDARGPGPRAFRADRRRTGAARGEAPPRRARTLPIAFLKPNRFQPRKISRDEELADLAASIKEKGVLQPILVRPVAGAANSYEIVAGERRWRAAQMAKLHDVPVVVREIGDAEALEIAIIENVQRADLNAVEEAAAYQELMDALRLHPGAARPGSRQEPQPCRQHCSAAEACPKRQGDAAGRTAHRRPCPHADRAGRPGGARARNHRRRAQCARSRTAFATAVAGESKAPAEKDADTRALESSVSNALGLKVQILHKGKRGRRAADLPIRTWNNWTISSGVSTKPAKRSYQHEN